MELPFNIDFMDDQIKMADRESVPINAKKKLGLLSKSLLLNLETRDRVLSVFQITAAARVSKDRTLNPPGVRTTAANYKVAKYYFL